ncbi:hypothetical protein GTR06_004546 [Salmonella enterica]|nr:hypothetical protein [Salmonella enterica]EDW9825677.1 hypothetical protein [Salmonella enterica]
MKLNITAPGVFFNRGGDRVTVDQIVLTNSAGAVVTFPVKGRVWKMYRGAYRPREFKIWTASGKFYAGEHSRSPWDIVGEVIADDVRPVYWQDLTDDQKATAAAKYHNGEGTPEDYFTYTPDQFIVINGDVYDLDADAALHEVEGLKGHVRILESTKADGAALAVQCVEGWDVVSVYRVKVTP